MKSLLKNEKGSHFFLDEAFGIGVDELKYADAVLSENVYFLIAYQHVDNAPMEEKLAGKPRSLFIASSLFLGFLAFEPLLYCK